MYTFNSDIEGNVSPKSTIYFNECLCINSLRFSF